MAEGGPHERGSAPMGPVVPSGSQGPRSRSRKGRRSARGVVFVRVVRQGKRFCEVELGTLTVLMLLDGDRKYPDEKRLLLDTLLSQSQFECRPSKMQIPNLRPSQGQKRSNTKIGSESPCSSQRRSCKIHLQNPRQRSRSKS